MFPFERCDAGRSSLWKGNFDSALEAFHLDLWVEWSRFMIYSNGKETARCLFMVAICEQRWVRGFWQKTLMLFLDVRSLLGIREVTLFVMNFYYVGKSAHETLLTSCSQVKAAFLVYGCKKNVFYSVWFFSLFNRTIWDVLKQRSHKI